MLIGKVDELILAPSMKENFLLKIERRMSTTMNKM